MQEVIDKYCNILKKFRTSLLKVVWLFVMIIYTFKFSLYNSML